MYIPASIIDSPVTCTKNVDLGYLIKCLFKLSLLHMYPLTGEGKPLVLWFHIAATHTLFQQNILIFLLFSQFLEIINYKFSDLSFGENLIT